ncbi:hypothetical protein [Embleya scabrispora]|uniref:hypothetical protein n=1 Tax=Embleya scabrispora TaxID=159449 RepID=UPI00131A0F5C|nr:hypothetical protein [Embleya scabrispora]MYS87774.1 hypothetical protein [Streptomyces sp. SID5474]
MRSLAPDGIVEATAELTRTIVDGEQDDLALLCVLALFTCSAASELDDYRTCDIVLDTLLDRTAGPTHDDRLLRAILLQQRALRWRDSGRRHIESSEEALRLLDTLDVSRLSPLPADSRPGSSDTATLARVVAAVRDAAYSLIPASADEAPRFGTSSEQVERVHRMRADTLSKSLEQAYKRAFRPRTRTIGGAGAPDMFFAALQLELLGHRLVYRARKETALMRLLADPGSTLRAEGLDDTLRLLRHAGAQSELEATVERFREAGPLSALSRDARQILLRRNSVSLLGSAELRVLRGAAEVLTSVEARTALESVVEVIANGGPMHAPGRWRPMASRLGDAWRSAAVLANTAGVPGRVAEILLDATGFAGPADNETLDRSIGWALNDLDWAGVPSEVTARWASWLEGDRSSLPVTVGVVEALPGVGTTWANRPVDDLHSAAAYLNALVGGVDVRADGVGLAVDLLKDSLAAIREEAARGEYSLHDRSAADVAAAYIVHADATLLWQDLAAFMVDGRVQRMDRSPAFDRLARERPSLPGGVAGIFREHAETLLRDTSMVDVFEPGPALVPYPEALRFLVCYDLVDEMRAHASIARLAGSPDQSAREEAARTVATVAAVRTNAWLLAFALQLSHDPRAAVKAYAGRALALLAVDHEFEPVASERLVELLREDGMLVPLLILRALDRNRVPPTVAQEITRLVDAHPSRLVRVTAATLSTPQDTANPGS